MHNFTVFITSYNYGHYIDKAIESVINQTVHEWNLYILDNGSSDNTETVIERYLSDPRIHFIRHPENVGHTMNITHGFTKLEGKYISTLQADDWLEPTFIEKALAAFESHPDAPLVAFGWMAYLESNDTYVYADTIPFPRDFSGLARLSPHLTLGNFVPLHLIVFRQPEISAIFREMINTPLRQLGEQYIIKRLEDRNGPSFFSAEVGGYWRRHDTQLTNANAQNFITGIEDVVEPLIYCQIKDSYNALSRFLSLAHFVSSGSQTPYRSAVEWLLSENGKHLGEQYGIEITGNERSYECLACALLMTHKALANNQVLSTDQIEDWLADIFKRFKLAPAQVLAVANMAYNGHFLPGNTAGFVAAYFDNNIQQPVLLKNSTLTGWQYSQWLAKRQLIAQDEIVIRESISKIEAKGISFHLLIRLQPGDETNLANTLDSLIQQFYGEWHLDIVTPLPSPEGLEDLPCIGWHTLGNPDETKATIDFLASTRRFDWLLEIPAGAKLDPLCLWRIAIHATTNSEACAFFVDDDCSENTGQRHSPRFKPGSNPAALQSADLAGPICIRHDAWLATGGASLRHGSPWFSQLLRIANNYGWESIEHIPDLLISYPGAFPSDHESCLWGLFESFTKSGVEGEIVPAGGNSWGIRYPIGTIPSISIAIISQGQIDLLSRCLDSITSKTAYPNFEIIIALGADNDPDLNSWLATIQQSHAPRITIIQITAPDANYATKCNAAVNASANDFVVLIKEEAVVIQVKWLEELVRTFQQEQVAGVSPRQITPGDGLIQNAGNVLGLNGIVGSPYQGKAKLADPGYLDSLQIARDVSTLPAACMMIRKTAYLAAGGMDETDLGNYFADADLCHKLRRNKQRLIYQPLATIVYGGSAELTIIGDTELKTRLELAEFHAACQFLARWQANATIDPYWNPNLSLSEAIPTLETDYRPQWQYLPSSAPRILARPLTNGQGIFRVTSPLRALRKAGLASECVWPQEGPREPSTAEVLRLSPDTIVVQHYIHDRFLAALQSWNTSPNRPFVVYTVDDLLTDMAESNPFRKNVPANSRARLKYALERCDRMVSSTEFLAETYRHLIPDIKVVPNRLEQEIWLPLQSRKRTANKPRIGWAGGATHQSDLMLLKEIIEQTRDEADWIFFGMCPDEIRPLLAEFHPFADFSEYPARLAALNLDIAVAPLAQIPFNQGKSNLRLLEYGVLGIPVICTDIDPYRGSPACCVDNTAGAWIKALRDRIHDADAREREGNVIRQWVHNGFLLENHLEEWLLAHLPERK